MRPFFCEGRSVLAWSFLSLVRDSVAIVGLVVDVPLGNMVIYIG